MLDSFFPQTLHFSRIHALGKKATIHQVATMLATSKNALFPGHNHWYWWLDTLIIGSKDYNQCRVIGTGGYDLEIGRF